MQKKILVKAKAKQPAPPRRMKAIAQMVSPFIRVQKTHIVTPYVYPGSDIPRYGIVVEIEPDDEDQATFLKKLEELATAEGVETIGHTDEGLIFIKFQTKEAFPICIEDPEEEEPPEIELSDEIPYGTNLKIEFDLNLYYNTTTRKKGFNFCPKKVILQLDNRTKKLIEVVNVGAPKNNRGRPKSKTNGDRMPKLEQRDKRAVGNKLRGTKNASKNKKA